MGQAVSSPSLDRGGRGPVGARPWIAITALMLVPGAGWAAQGSTPPAAQRPPVAPQASRGNDGPQPKAPVAAEQDSGTRSVATRARMSECAHQWSNLKRAGTASGIWRDFARTCLAQK